MIVHKGEGRRGGPAGRGHSFKKLAAYLLSPKDAGDRALWSDVLNVGTDNPHMAARVMAATAMNADAIKARAGVGRAGRKSEAGAVYHVVMSWAADETPSPEHQREAARDLMKALGMDTAQALVVAHDDNGKPHLHIVANLTDPATGKQYSLSNDQRRMSDWALAYEKANGGVRVQQRADNAERRKRGEQTKDTRSLSRPEYERMQASAREAWAKRRAERDAAFNRQAQERTDQRAQHAAEWKAAKGEAAAHRKAHDAIFRAALASAKAADKVTNKPVWRDVFDAQKRERMQAAGAVDRAASALDAASQRYRGAQEITAGARRLCKLAERFERSVIARKVLKPLGFNVSADRQRATLLDAERRQGEAAAALPAYRAELQARRDALAAMPAKHEAERKAKAAELNAATLARVKAAVQAVNPVDFAAMIQRQDEERRRLIEAQNAERAALGMKPYQPRGKEAGPVEPQRMQKNADRARQAFDVARKPDQPEKAPAPARQQAGPTLAPKGHSNGNDPGAPVRQAQPQAKAPEKAPAQSLADMKAKAAEQFAKAAEKANSPEAQARRAEQAKQRGKDFDRER